MVSETKSPLLSKVLREKESSIKIQYSNKIDLIGDLILLNNSRLFRLVRNFAIDSGIRFSGQVKDLQWYLARPLERLDEMADRKLVIYDPEFAKYEVPINDLGSIHPRVAILHETLHLLFRVHIGTPNNIYMGLSEEALVDTLEWLLSYDQKTGVGQLAFRLQSPVQIPQNLRSIADRFLKDYSLNQLVVFLVRSYLSALLMRDDHIDIDFTEACKSLHLIATPDLKELYIEAFQLDEVFRKQTTWKYFSDRYQLPLNETKPPKLDWSDIPAHTVSGIRLIQNILNCDGLDTSNVSIN
jgi:hypothetical protein